MITGWGALLAAGIALAIVFAYFVGVEVGKAQIRKKIRWQAASYHRAQAGYLDLTPKPLRDKGPGGGPWL